MDRFVNGGVNNFLRNIALLNNHRTRRISSYDRTGGNKDNVTIPAGETNVLADIKDSGCITHIWATVACRDLHHERKIILRMFWDQEKNASVEVPIGEVATSIIKTAIRDKDSNGKLHHQWLPTLRKFGFEPD